MNYENMSFEELKDIAKQNGITVGNISKPKLIEKIINQTETTKSVINEDTDLNNNLMEENAEVNKESAKSTLDSIISTIDDIDGSDDFDKNEKIENLPIDTVIPVRSITFGTLIYKSRSNNAAYIWNEIGAVENMTIAAIVEMNNYNTNYLNKPLVILLDERAVKQFRLTKTYEDVAKINNLKELFKSDIETISKTIDNALAVNMRDILISKVRTMYKKKTLTDINIIRLLERKLQFDLSDDNSENK